MSAPQTLAAANAAGTLVMEVETLLGSLCDLLDRETDAVRAADFNTFRAIQSDKVAMLTRYKSLMETLTRQKASLQSGSDTLKRRLQDISKRFQGASDRNTKALEAGRKSMQRISDRIIKCARDTVHANRQTYNRRGYSSLNAKTPVSLKLDEVL